MRLPLVSFAQITMLVAKDLNDETSYFGGNF